MTSPRLAERTRRALNEVLRRQGYVSAVDVLLQMGTLTKETLEDWRFGRVPYLERKLTGGLGKMSTTLREMQRLCQELGLQPSRTAYHKWGKGPKRALRFSKSGDRHVEDAYSTHWVSERLRKQQVEARRQPRPSAPPTHRTSQSDQPVAIGPERSRPPLLRPPETDLNHIRQLADEQADENSRLCAFLKRGAISRREVDRRFHRLYDWARAEIDCTACGNCCTDPPVVVTPVDVQRLARWLGQTPSDFRSRHVHTAGVGEVLGSQPCPFLAGTRCSCYAQRPEVCRAYPHLHQRDMPERMSEVIDNASTCPLVFNVLEALKQELGDRWRRD